MSDPKIIGERLKKLRAEKKKSRNAVAEKVGVSISALQMYENGKRIPRDEIKVKIAAYYQSSIESIFFA